MATSPFVIDIAFEDLKRLEALTKLGNEFEREANKVFETLVFDIHKYLIRVTPLDTGQLRGGWTAFLDSKRISYSQQIFDPSLAIKARSRTFHPTLADVQKGRVLSKYNANETTVTLFNLVPYAFYLEHGTARLQGRNFTAMARFKGELRFRTVYNQWFQQISDAGEIVPFKSEDEDITN